jgi:drug/metabolite transporter (DMT)-like permease
MSGTELATGILLSFTGTTICNYGMNLQKYSFFVKEQDPDAVGAARKQYITWSLGFGCFVFGQLGILISLGFVDQATAAIFSNVALISNAFFARYFFQEVFTARDLVAMSLILLGSFLVVVFFKHQEQNFDVHNLRAFMCEPLFITFMGLMFIAFLFCAEITRRYWKQRRDHPAAAGLVFASMAALVGCCSLTFGKMFIQMIKETISNQNQFGDLLAWVITLLFLFCAISNVGLINMGLANSPAMVMIPIYYVLNTLLATAAGILCFQDYATFTSAVPSFLFLVGAIGSLVGVVVLSKKEASAAEESTGEQPTTAEMAFCETGNPVGSIVDVASQKSQLEDAKAESPQEMSANEVRSHIAAI